MSPAKALILVCGVLALSACGSSRSGQPADDGQDAALPSPRIEAIDEPTENAWRLDENTDVMWTSWNMCFDDGSKTQLGKSCDQAPQANDRLGHQGAKPERATGRGLGAEPRAIAQLGLENRGRGARLVLIAWKSEHDKLCLAHDETDKDGGAGGGTFGPCRPGGPCGAICLAFSVRDSSLNAVAGVVSARADSLRITLDGGRVARYRLDGPLVPGFPVYRIFMLDLGRGADSRLELFDGEKLIAHEKRLDGELMPVRCDKPPIAPTPGAEGRKSPLDECFERAGAK